MKLLRLLVVAAALVALALPSAASAAEAPKSSTAPKPRGVHYVYLIRHGIYDLDTTATSDVTGNGLNALGHEQAKLCGAYLAKLPITIHAFVASDFRRARETAADIGAVIGRTAVLDSSLRECTPTADRPDYMSNHTAGEIAECDSARAIAWRRYFTPTPDADTHDVLVWHGNGIRWTVARALGMDTRSWTRMDIANCGLTVIAVRPDGSTRLVMYSDANYLPLDKQTWSGPGAGWKAAAAAKGMK